MPPTKAELASLSEIVPEGCLLSCFQELVKVKISRTPYKEVTLTLHLLPTYPETPLIAEFASSSLPDALLARFKEAVEREARSRAGSPQLVEAVQLVQRLVCDNLLIGCWDEIRQAKTLLGDSLGTLKLSEKTGSIGLSVTSAGHTVEVTLRIPDAYPAEPVAAEVQRSTFPADVTSSFTLKLAEMTNRLSQGVAVEASAARKPVVGAESVRGVDSVQPGEGGRLGERAKELTKLKTKKAADEVSVDLSSHGIHELKTDREFLHQFANVRGSHEQRKDRRRLVHVQNKQDAEAAAAAAARRAAHLSTGRQPLRSVLAAIRFVAEEWVLRMSREPCQICERLVLPHPVTGATHGTECSTAGCEGGGGGGGAYHKSDPIRTLCGHWYHFGCLDPHLTAPPFDKKCAACGAPIEHAHWTKAGQRALLEKRWAFEEARRREVGDVSDFLGL
jgi:hypothetical protein